MIKFKFDFKFTTIREDETSGEAGSLGAHPPYAAGGRTSLEPVAGAARPGAYAKPDTDPDENTAEVEPDATAAIRFPKSFQDPGRFRAELEGRSAPPPRLSVPPAPVYLALMSAMAYWCYFGYQYGQTHFPVSLGAVFLFFGVLFVLLIALVLFHAYCARVRLYPVLKRIADQRPGAFLVVDGRSPTLYYARKTWIGRVNFRMGGEHQEAYSRLDARLSRPLGQIEIRRKRVLDRVLAGTARNRLWLPEGELGRKFAAFGEDSGLIERFLDTDVSSALVQLARLGAPQVTIDGASARVQVGKDLSARRKEAPIEKFLTDAETVVEAASR